VTRGEHGVVAGAAGSDTVFAVPAVRAPVIDTTGAGDAFHGAAAWALLSGWTWEESLRAAAWVAARKCGTPGARAGLPFAADLPAREALLTGVR
jgi:sulfofructose kinase